MKTKLLQNENGMFWNVNLYTRLEFGRNKQMSIITKILGSLLALFSISMWYGHRQYVKRKIPFQYATAYQTILVTFTSIGLLAGCHLWIFPIAIFLWFFMQYLVMNWRFSNRKFFDPSCILFSVVLFFCADFCWTRSLSLLGWIISFITTAILYFIALSIVFPVLEKREWK